jgi:HEAT repeat protein
MAALRNLPSPQVQAFVAKWVDVHAETVIPAERVILRRAAMVLGWLGGPAMVDRLALLFKNDDADVRLDAVLALGISRAPRAAWFLRKRLDKEPEERIRQQIQRVLLSMDATTAPPYDPPPRKTRPLRTEF